MWMSKKVRRVLLAVVVLVLALSAGSLAQPVEIEFAYSWMSGERGEITQALVDEFNAQQTEIRVKLIAATGNFNEWLSVRLAANQQPDLTLHQPQTLKRNSEFLVDLGQILERRGLYQSTIDDFFPPALNEASEDGMLLGMPINTQIATIYYYVPEVLAESGIAAPQVGWTWDDLVQMAQKASRRDAEGPTRWGVIPQHNTNWIRSTGLQNEAPWFSEDGRTFLPNPEAMIDAMEWSINLIERGLLHEGNGRPVFLESGNAAIYVDGTYRLPAIRDRGIDVGVAPPILGKTGGADGASHSLMAFKTGNLEKEQAAATFIFWFAEAAQAARYAVTWGDLGARKSTLTHPNYAPAQEGVRRDFHAYIDYYVPQFGNPAFPAARGTWDEYVNKAFRGEMPAASAVESAKREIQHVFDGYYDGRE